MTHRCPGIIPPYLLEALAGSDVPDVAQAARHSLQVQRGLRVLRQTRSARRPAGPPTARAGRSAEATPDEGSPGASAPGIIPDTMRRAVHPAAEISTAAEPALDGAPPAPPGPRRSVHDAEHGTRLPGVLRRAEGDPPDQDESVNEAYDGLGATWNLLWQAYQRDSLDGRGLPLLASVHFERNYVNAFWDGRQMVFGDGDGVLFRSFTDAPDVIGHELAHGLTQYTAGFVYVGQSGALNESMSDVFGVLTVQHLGNQRADQADWLVGAGLFTDRVKGVALRSLKAPGTAYDDPVLGKDPQPARMADYVLLPHDDQHDNGGVHINSGIPNHAFYLAATALGGFAWQGAGQIWYDALAQARLPMDADFATFAGATVRQAELRYGPDSPEQRAVEDAWRAVGVLKPALVPPRSRSA